MWIRTEMNSRQPEGSAPPAGAGRRLPWAAWLLALLLVATPALAPALAQEQGQDQGQEPETTAPAESATEAPDAEAPDALEGQAALENPAAPEAPAEADEVGDGELRDELLERYQALPARDGVLLVPREDVPGISSIEIADGEVVVNGEPVGDTILRSWLGDEAEPLLALAALDTEAARNLLRVDVTGGGEAVPVTATADDDERDTDRRRSDDEADEDRREIRLGQQFKIGSDVIIEENEVASEATAIGGSVVIRGRVLRDVVAVGGSIEVEGEVGGTMVGVLGGVFLGPDSRVDGDITAVGSGVRRAPGASVGGQVVEVSVPGGGGHGDWEEWVEGRRYRGGDFLRQWETNEAYWNLVGSVLLGLLACLALLIARGPVERVERRIANGSDFLGAGVVGVLVQLLILPILAIVCFFLIITIVGCLALPLIPFILLALVVAALFGYAGVALRVGRWLGGRFGWELSSPYAALLLGVALIEVWKLIGETLDIFGGPAWFFAAMFLFAGVVVEYVAWSVGLGAILMNWFDGRRDRRMPPPPPGDPYRRGGVEPHVGYGAYPAGPATPAAERSAGEPAAEAPPAPVAPPAPPADEPPTPPEEPAEDREPGDEPGR